MVRSTGACITRPSMMLPVATTTSFGESSSITQGPNALKLPKYLLDANVTLYNRTEDKGNIGRSPYLSCRPWSSLLLPLVQYSMDTRVWPFFSLVCSASGGSGTHFRKPDLFLIKHSARSPDDTRKLLPRRFFRSDIPTRSDGFPDFVCMTYSSVESVQCHPTRQAITFRAHLDFNSCNRCRSTARQPFIKPCKTTVALSSFV
jgi:hypothetical protein